MRSMTLLTILGTLVGVPATALAHGKDHHRDNHHERRDERRDHRDHKRFGHHVRVQRPVHVVAPPVAVTRVWVPAHWIGVGRHRVFVSGAWTVGTAPTPPPPPQPQWVWDAGTQRWIWR